MYAALLADAQRVLGVGAAVRAGARDPRGAREVEERPRAARADPAARDDLLADQPAGEGDRRCTTARSRSRRTRPDANVQTRASTMWAIAIAVSLRRARRPREAADQADRSSMYTKEIARLEKDKPDDPMLPVYLGMLGYTYRQDNDLANASKVFKKVIAIDEKKTGGYLGVRGRARRDRARGRSSRSRRSRCTSEASKQMAQAVAAVGARVRHDDRGRAARARRLQARREAAARLPRATPRRRTASTTRCTAMVEQSLA